MPERMARRRHHRDLALAKIEDIALLDLQLNAGNAIGLALGPNDFAAEYALQRQIARRMVAMVMRGEDMRELPAALDQLFFDLAGIRSIDRSRCARRVVMHQDTVI